MSACTVRHLVLGLTLALGNLAIAADIPVVGLKLIVVDKLAAASKAKAVFVAKDGAVTKGAGTDPADISARLDVAYDSVNGAFVMLEGANWLVNKSTVAKYVNKTAPSGGAVKVSVIKPGTLVKVVAKSLGDIPLDMSAAPGGAVYVAGTIVNGGDQNRLCTQFNGCVHKSIAGGTGYKLICKGNSSGDGACTAAACVAISGRFCDLGDGTVHDAATDLQWEKKDTAFGSGVDPGNLHDVDNTYLWAGTCSVTASKRCQPNLAAETACKAQTDAAHWASGCEQCVGGEGTCTVAAPAITTVWDWLAQVNAANYAGHNDWRLPSESGCNTCYTDGVDGLYVCTSCSAHELETILLSPYPCDTGPCIAPIFGPTASSVLYWSASTYTANPTRAWRVYFYDGAVFAGTKTAGNYVRAVRGGS